MATDPHATNSNPSPAPTHVPWEGPKGWGFAAFICILSAAMVFGAWTIHKATYKSPRDPTNVDGDHPAQSSAVSAPTPIARRNV
jgi:hypothetical protein